MALAGSGLNFSQSGESWEPVRLCKRCARAYRAVSPPRRFAHPRPSASSKNQAYSKEMNVGRAGVNYLYTCEALSLPLDAFGEFCENDMKEFFTG
jgi:hypothetical protein